jgi:hypothetical protein
VPYVVLKPQTLDDLRRCFARGAAPPRNVFERCELELIEALARAVDEAQAKAGRPPIDRPVVDNRPDR